MQHFGALARVQAQCILEGLDQVPKSVRSKIRGTHAKKKSLRYNLASEMIGPSVEIASHIVIRICSVNIVIIARYLCRHLHISELNDQSVESVYGKQAASHVVMQLSYVCEDGSSFNTILQNAEAWRELKGAR